jgi:gas vesicle protein
MSDAVAGLIGALVGGAAAIAGAWLQIRAERKAARDEREAAAAAARAEQRELTNQRRQALARRYLFNLQDATESLRRRLENWAERGGQKVADASDPGYWDITTLYVVARALAAERILAVEGVYPALRADLPDLVEFFESDGVEAALNDTLGEHLFRYHRLALAEAALERDPDGFRVLIYSEFRRRYEDPGWGLQRLLAPATDALTGLTRTQMRELESRLVKMAARLETATGVPRKT